MPHLAAVKQATGEAVYCDDMPKYAGKSWQKKIVGKLQCELLLAQCPSLCGRLSYFASLLLKRSDTVVGTAQRKVRGTITVLQNKRFDCSIVILSFRRTLSSCCLQQTCPCKPPVSMFILVCNTSFWLQLFKGWITLSKNLFPLDNVIVSYNTYALDSDLSIGQYYPTFE